MLRIAQSLMQRIRSFWARVYRIFERFWGRKTTGTAEPTTTETTDTYSFSYKSSNPKSTTSHTPGTSQTGDSLVCTRKLSRNERSAASTPTPNNTKECEPHQEENQRNRASPFAGSTEPTEIRTLKSVSIPSRTQLAKPASPARCTISSTALPLRALCGTSKSLTSPRNKKSVSFAPRLRNSPRFAPRRERKETVRSSSRAHDDFTCTNSSSTDGWTQDLVQHRLSVRGVQGRRTHRSDGAGINSAITACTTPSIPLRNLSSTEHSSMDQQEMSLAGVI